MSRRTERYIPEKDIDYICYAMDAHLDLLQNGFSSPLDGSLKKERAVNYSLIEKLDKDIPLSPEDYWDLYYIMSERADNVAEGRGVPYNGFSAPNDAGKTSRLLRQLGERLGILVHDESDDPVECDSAGETKLGYSY